MKVNTQNIQRPALFEPFFDIEIMWNNEYLTYIQTFVDSVTSNLCNTAKISINNIKDTLNSSNKHSALTKLGKLIIKTHKELRLLEQNGVKDNSLRASLRDLNKLRFCIKFDV